MLRLATLTEIAAAAAVRAREERVVAQYLGLGRRRPPAMPPAPSFRRLLLTPDAADLEAFDGDGERRLKSLLSALSTGERHELLALVFYAKSPSLGFARAMRRAYRIPPEAQMGYLMSRRLERDIPSAIDRIEAASKSSGGVT